MTWFHMIKKIVKKNPTSVRCFTGSMAFALLLGLSCLVHVISAAPHSDINPVLAVSVSFNIDLLLISCVHLLYRVHPM